MQKSAAAGRTPARLGASPANAALTVESLAPYALWTLLAAGLGELFLYRMLSRIGVHIPKDGLVLDVYSSLVRTGSFAFNVSSVAVFLALGLLAYACARRWGGRRPLRAVTPALIAAFGAISLLFAFVDEGDSAKLAYGAFSAGLMIALAAIAWTDGRSDHYRKATVGLIVLAYLFAQYYTLSNQAYRALDLTTAPPQTARALEMAELLVVATALLAFWRWSGVRAGLNWRPSPVQLGVAGLLIFAFLGAYRGEDSSTAAILSLWTVGLTLYLPLPVYALALGLYGAALVACLGRARRDPAFMPDAVALGLLPVAGLTLDLTYQHLVAIVALLLLVQPSLAPSDAQDAVLA
ncbi:MAG: hypothetical protein Q7R32_00650, partial [Dehalococcoidia bacterium]|nr:hypothetical protein [Dehalococcoidia bacterium]